MSSPEIPHSPRKFPMSIGSPIPLWFIKSGVTIALAQADNADRVSILVHCMAERDAPPDHVHEDETIHVLKGELVLRIGDPFRTARAGDTVLALRDVPHTFTVAPSGGAHVLTMTHGGFENLVREMSRPAPDDGLPPFRAPSPEMRSTLVECCAANGTILLGPGAIQGAAFAA